MCGLRVIDVEAVSRCFVKGIFGRIGGRMGREVHFNGGPVWWRKTRIKTRGKVRLCEAYE